MYVRLAFAVAAHLEPEILIVDEVLAVGDAEFQRKCMGKMGDVAGQGRTVLFVSHNMGAVQTLCQRAVLMERGRVKQIGSSREVVAEYLKASDAAACTPLAERRDRDRRRSFPFRGTDPARRRRPAARLRRHRRGPVSAPSLACSQRRTSAGARWKSASPSANHRVCASPKSAPTSPAKAQRTARGRSRSHLPHPALAAAAESVSSRSVVRHHGRDRGLPPRRRRAARRAGQLLPQLPGRPHSPVTDKNGYCMIPQHWGIMPPSGNRIGEAP